MSQQSLIIEKEDNFKPVFKYYKQRRPTPNLKDAIDFFKQTPKERFEVLKLPLIDNQKNICSNDATKLGLNPMHEWKCLRLLDLDSNGDRSFSGLIVISNAFSEEGQVFWSLKCMKDYAKNPPNKTNVDNLVRSHKKNSYNLTTDQDLVPQYKTSSKKLKFENNAEAGSSVQSLKTNHSEKHVTEKIQEFKQNHEYDWWQNVYNKWSIDRFDNIAEDKFIRFAKIESKINELRWATLGYHHDWDTKKYSDESVSPFPSDLGHLCKKVMSFIGGLNQKDIKERYISEYKPEAAIVNFYPAYSNLGGHTDHSEPNRKAPLLSFSFGLSAVFLCGGPTKETKPTAMILRSGDILIMTEVAREKFHGVPRIIDEKMVLSNSENLGNETGESPKQCEKLLPDFSNVKLVKDMQCKTDEVIFAKMYLRNHRININVRQVF